MKSESKTNGVWLRQQETESEWEQWPCCDEAKGGD